MVCMLCDSKTRITNSRSNAPGYQTWRRHTCNRCSAVYTTRESIDMSLSYRVERIKGNLEPFSRDKLFMSIARALEHRPNYIEDSGMLMWTILDAIQSGKQLVISRNDLVSLVTSTLRRFDIGSSQIYRSRHSIL